MACKLTVHSEHCACWLNVQVHGLNAYSSFSQLEPELMETVQKGFKVHSSFIIIIILFKDSHLIIACGSD